MSYMMWQYIFTVKNLVQKIEITTFLNGWIFDIKRLLLNNFSDMIMALWVCFWTKRITSKGTFWNLYWYETVTGVFFNIIWKEVVGVLVHSGCYNQLPQTGWLISSRNVLLVILEADSLRSGCRHGQVRPAFWSQTSLCVCTWQKALGISLGSNPIHKGSTHMT